MSYTVDDDPPIKTGPANKAYRDNWERIFGDGSKEPDPDEIEAKLTIQPPDEPCDVCGAPAGKWCRADCSECPCPKREG